MFKTNNSKKSENIHNPHFSKQNEKARLLCNLYKNPGLNWMNISGETPLNFDKMFSGFVDFYDLSILSTSNISYVYKLS